MKDVSGTLEKKDNETFSEVNIYATTVRASSKILRVALVYF